MIQHSVTLSTQITKPFAGRYSCSANVQLASALRAADFDIIGSSHNLSRLDLGTKPTQFRDVESLLTAGRLICKGLTLPRVAVQGVHRPE